MKYKENCHIVPDALKDLGIERIVRNLVGKLIYNIPYDELVELFNPKIKLYTDLQNGNFNDDISEGEYQELQHLSINRLNKIEITYNGKI